MKKFFIKMYMCLVIFSVVLFGVIVVAFVVSDSGSTTTTRGHSMAERSEGLMADFGIPDHVTYHSRGVEIWTYRVSRTKLYIKNGLLVDYVVNY